MTGHHGHRRLSATGWSGVAKARGGRLGEVLSPPTESGGARRFCGQWTIHGRDQLAGGYRARMDRPTCSSTERKSRLGAGGMLPCSAAATWRECSTAGRPVGHNLDIARPPALKTGPPVKGPRHLGR